MQDIIDPLSVIAEFSIGLAGFTGIVAALSHVNEGVRVLIHFRFANLLIAAFAPGFFALLTISLSYMGIEATSLLKMSSLGLMGYVIFWLAWAAVNSPPGIHPAFKAIMWTLGFINIFMQGTASYLQLEELGGYYLLGLIIMLFQAAFLFSALALLTLKTRSSP